MKTSPDNDARAGVIGRLLGDAATAPSRPPNPWMKYLAIACVLIGVGGIVWIIDSIGMDALGEVLSNVSPAKCVALLGFYLLATMFDALSWQRLIRPANRPGAWTLWKACVAGSAINQLTPTGNLGEPIKVMLLTGRTDVKDAIAALVMWNFLYLLATMAWVLIVAVPIFLFLPMDTGFMLLYLGGALVLGLPAFALLAALRFNLISRLAALCARFGVGRERLLGWQGKVRLVEDAVVKIARTRPRDMLVASVHLMTARGISITMAYGMVWALGLDVPFITVLYIQMLSLAVSTVFAFVPARVGVTEGYSAMIYKALDYTPQAGLAVSVIGRGIQVVTTLLAVGILAAAVVRARGRRPAAP